MPIRRELRHFYRGPVWEATRERIVERADHKCERCGKPDGEKVLTRIIPAVRMFWCDLKGGKWRDDVAKVVKLTPAILALRIRTIRVVICVCHINGVAGDDRDDNLAAWCQWCHLNHDVGLHRVTRCLRKDAARPLLAIPIEIEGLRAMQREARDAHFAGNNQGVLGMSDAVMEEVLIIGGAQ